MTTPIACPKCQHVNQVETEDLPNYLAGKEIGEMTCRGCNQDFEYCMDITITLRPLRRYQNDHTNP